MLKKLFMLALVAFVGVMIGCKGDDGAVGPKGDKGDKGDTGATGPQGPAGSSDSSSAGVSYILKTGAFETDSLGDASFFYEGFFEGASEEAIASVEQGVVLAYIKSGSAWFAVPGVVLFADQTSANYSFAYGVDGTDFVFQILRLAGSAGAPAKRKLDDIRVVLVPGLELRKNADVNWKSYDEAMKALGLTESNFKLVKQKK